MNLYLLLLFYIFPCRATVTSVLYSKIGVLPFELDKLAFALSGKTSKFQVLSQYFESDVDIDDFEMQLWNLSSNIKASMPFLQMYDQLYHDTIVPSTSDFQKCNVWASIGQKQVCNLNDLQMMIDSDLEVLNHKQIIYPFDISNPSRCSDQLPVVILYGDPSDSTVLEYFNLLRDKSDEGKVCFVFRFKLDSYERGRFALSGYGVELAVKSTEYKVVDDRIISNIFQVLIIDSKNKGSDSLLEADSDDQSLDILDEPIPVIQKLSSEQIKDLPFQIIQFVKDSTDPMKRLLKVVCDFPKHGHIIGNFRKLNLANMTRDSKIMNELNMNTHVFKKNNGLWINHIPLDIDQLDIFSLLQKIRKESEIFSALSSYGFNHDSSLKLLTAPLIDDSVSNLPWGPSFKFNTDHVIWWNNVEKDKRYFRFPSDITAV